MEQKGSPEDLTQSREARRRYREEISRFPADDLVFLDESIFNEKTGWRHMAYAPIGHEARYSASVRRGKTWSILAAMTLEGWLDCTGIKEGYYNRESLYSWLEESLLPTLDRVYGRPIVIILDNCSTHIDDEVREIVQTAGHILHYLPPYSPDYNPIELTFSVLKAWIKRYYHYLRPAYDNFGSFLTAAIEGSRCDRFAQQQFRHAADGIYIEREKLDEIWDQLQAYMNGTVELLEVMT